MQSQAPMQKKPFFSPYRLAKAMARIAPIGLRHSMYFALYDVKAAA